MLNDLIFDFELASYADAYERKNVFRLGTVPFMSREALDGFSEKHEHGLPHDLESAYYVITARAAGYRGSIPKSDPLRKWRKGDFAKIRSVKNEHMRLRDSPFDEEYVGEMAIPIGHVLMDYHLDKIRREYMQRANNIYLTAMNQEMEQFRVEREIIEGLIEQATLEGKPEREMAHLVMCKRDELASARRSERVGTNTISFKKWMKATRISVEWHSECDCCEED